MPLPPLDKLALRDKAVFAINPPKDAPVFPRPAKKIDLAEAAILFAIKESQLPKYLDTMMALPPEGVLWVCFPKLGKLDTDLGRDKLWGWMKEKGFQGEKVINIDDTWSAFSFKR